MPVTPDPPVLERHQSEVLAGLSLPISIMCTATAQRAASVRGWYSEKSLQRSRTSQLRGQSTELRRFLTE